MTEQQFVKICPQCGSTDIIIPPAGQDVAMSIQDYCKDCKAEGIFPEVASDKIAEFKKTMGKK